MAELDFEIDGLTHSIKDMASGESWQTDILPLDNSDLQQVSKNRGWRFDWKAEFAPGRNVCKLVTQKEPKVIHGLISYTKKSDHLFMNLIESAPFNIGKTKKYQGVAGNLIAYVCMQSFVQGFSGCVTFQAKTNLISHYQATLGAELIGSQRMIIETKQAIHLVITYFPEFFNS